jgi:2-dehydro-3-deoxygluconokinase
MRGSGVPEVVTLGETMAVLTPTRPGRLASSRTLHLGIGGAESNVAISLARLGVASGWVSAVGQDELGDLVLSTVRGEGVDCAHVTRSEAPTGLYLRDQAGNDQVRAFYYRSGSAASRMGPGQLPETYLKGAKVLHLSGITLALSESCRELVHAAAQCARREGVVVSFDVNYRGRLWAPAAARSAADAMLEQVDILFAGEDEVELLWGESGPEWLARMRALGVGEVVLKRGAGGAAAARDGDVSQVAGLPVPVRDTVGAGDAFAAGYLAALCWGADVPQRLRYGNAMGAWCVMNHGDYENAPRRSDLEAFIEQRASIGR